MKLPWKKSSVIPTKTPREQDICQIHGDISSETETGGISFGIYTPNRFCPLCFGEFLEREFPVLIKVQR